MKKFKAIIAICLATMTLAAMAGGVVNAAAKKINMGAIPSKKTVVTAPAFNYVPAGYTMNYSTFGAIR